MRRIIKPFVFVAALLVGVTTSAMMNLIRFRSEPPKMKTLASGLRYIELVEGSGTQPLIGQIVSVHYVGTLESGKQFDSSLDRGPFEFRLGAGQVISGFEEGVSTMKVGGKRKLIIPANLAYGHRGRPSMILPDATLIFDVDLLTVYQ